jgi:hypothetical protein
MMQTTERPLTPAERGEIADRLARLRASSGRSGFVRVLLASLVVCGVLAALTLALSDAPAGIIAAFWGAMTLILSVGVARSLQADMRPQQAVLEDVLAAGRARELRIQSARVLEFEEVEDEGACYAFEHAPDACVILFGQQFYSDETFPNSDFSLVEVLGSNGVVADEIIQPHGRRLQPARTVPREEVETIERPEHLTVVPAGIDDLVAYLRGAGA